MSYLPSTFQTQRSLGFVAVGSLLAYFSLDYLLALPAHSSSEFFLRISFFANLFLYGLAVGCALGACFFRTSRLDVWLGGLTLVAALVAPLHN